MIHLKAGKRWLLVGATWLGLSACGARTQLKEDTPARRAPGAGSRAAPTPTSSGPRPIPPGPCLSDQACDDGIPCSIDRCEPSGCTHTPDAGRCDDGAFCTTDVCDVAKGCVHAPADALCDDGIACTSDSCDEKTGTCEHDPCDQVCDDQLFCTGVERCDTTLGCTSGPPSCALGLACSQDTCDEAKATCAHVQPAGCAPPLLLLVIDEHGALQAVSPYTGSVSALSGAGRAYLDVAILAGRWFALDIDAFVEFYPYTNDVKNSFPPVDGNSLAAGPDGYLYAASKAVSRINPDTGVAEIVGKLPPGLDSSGDIAFANGRMFVSTDGPCGGALVEMDLQTGTGTVLGGDGLGCVYGLAAVGSTLFLVNCDGTIGTFDPTTGVARILSSSSVSVYGADVLP